MKVVVRFSDGLGNQLFQFALGRYIADILDCDMFSDETHFIVSENRTFQMRNLLQPNSLRRWGRFREFAFFLLWMIKYKFGEKEEFTLNSLANTFSPYPALIVVTTLLLFIFIYAV